MSVVQALTADFFLKPTVEVARSLLGCVLVFSNDEGEVSGRIVETEAYCSNDPACHSYKGITPRNSPMWGEPGRAYIYQSYGIHWCFNIVTQPTGVGEAVLIRAVEPLTGLDIMRRNRPNCIDDTRLCAGPANFTKAFGLTGRHNRLDCCGGDGGVLSVLHIADIDDERVRAGKRIGISLGTEQLWRFYDSASASVSRK